MTSQNPSSVAYLMTSRISLPEEYVHYMDGLVRDNERRLAPLVRALSDRYVGKSTPNTPPLRATSAWRTAYTYYYGPVNALKLQAIAVELALRDPAWPGKHTLRLLDLGAGPGSATAGILLWNPSLELDSVWVDADPAWDGFALVQPWIDTGALRVRRDTRDLATEIQGSFDLVLAANVVTEMQADVHARAARLDRLFTRALAPGGTAIIVEPALRQTTRDLHTLRDRMLAAGWHVLAPCTGRGPCPMLANDRDWCHETRDWIQPDFHHRLDQLAGLEKDALRFSFLAISRTPAPATSPCAARIVSEIRHQKGRIRLATCDEHSRLAAWEIQQRDVRANREFRSTVEALRRGSLVCPPHDRGGRLDPTDTFRRLL